MRRFLLFMLILFISGSALADWRFNPFTRKQDYYEDDADDILPDQTGNSGKFLTTNGTASSWGTAVATESDPVAAAVNGILKSNGSTLSAAVAGTDYVATESDPKVGTLTNTKWCVTDGSVVNCTEDAPAGSGDVTSVGDCEGGACFDGSSDGGTYFDFYDAQGRTRLIGGDTSGETTLTLSTATGTIYSSADTPGGSLGGTWASPTIDDLFIKLAGDVATAGTYDFGEANVFLELPNVAGDVALTTAGQVAVDTTQKQLVVYDGAEKVLPLNHLLEGTLGTGVYDADSDVFIVELDTSVFPDGIVITAWEVKCNEADPDTELDANLMYCDDNDTGAFPGANATLVDVLDTTTGNSSCADMSGSDLGSGVIPAGKMLYVDIDADPTSDTTLFYLIIKYYIPES